MVVILMGIQVRQEHHNHDVSITDQTDDYQDECLGCIVSNDVWENGLRDTKCECAADCKVQSKQNRPAGERSDTETSPGLPNVLSGNIAGEALFPAPEGSIKKAHKNL
ncbi:hypothetical protein Bca4012_071824 [Brassica carinata]|uniref:(rape) hypothetical protein n=1 Tax=Brassica napus TaxID=3708 RepID=A0A078J6P8_BRANA|nr:unnamed protein product [Brassica napus]CDY60399.1 BnaCnng36220D [Brassica napus]